MSKKRTHTRAPNGSGTIYEDNGKYRVQVMVGQRRVSRSADTKEEALKLRRRLLADRDEGLIPVPSQDRLVDYMNYWLKYTKQGDLRPHSRDSYESRLNLVAKYIGGQKMSRLRPSHFDYLRVQLLEAGYASATIHKTMVVLRMCLNDAIKRNELPRNLLDAWKNVQKKTVPHEVIPEELVQPFLDSVRGTFWGALWTTGIGVGLRIGELMALRWDDIEGDTLHVRHTVTTGRGRGRFIGPVKTEKSQRDIVLPDEVQSALRTHRLIVVGMQLSAGIWNDQRLVFPNRHGGFLSIQTVNRKLKAHLAAVGGPELSSHSLRHTCATLHLRMGTRLEVVRDLLGHSSVAMTADLYAHVLRSMEEEAAEKMSAFLKRSS